MAKKRKTRKEKMLSDTRIQQKIQAPAISIQEDTVQLSLSDQHQQASAPSIRTTSPVPPATVVSSGYQYLKVDLRKTLILTASVVIVELCIKLLHF